VSNVNEGSSVEISDDESLGHSAKNKAERRKALQACLAGRWKNKDIGRLERVDEPSFHGWVAWTWKQS